MVKSKLPDPLKEIKEQIDKIYSDTSVSPSSTLERMEELKDHIQWNIDALNDTMRDKEEE
jgi:hypothetical protein